MKLRYLFKLCNVIITTLQINCFIFLNKLIKVKDARYLLLFVYHRTWEITFINNCK